MRSLLLALLLVPALCWGQRPVDERGSQAVKLFTAEIVALKAEARTCLRNSPAAYCEVLMQQIALLEASRKDFCQQFAISQGEHGCP